MRDWDEADGGAAATRAAVRASTVPATASSVPRARASDWTVELSRASSLVSCRRTAAWAYRRPTPASTSMSTKAAALKPSSTP